MENGMSTQVAAASVAEAQEEEPAKQSSDEQQSGSDVGEQPAVEAEEHNWFFEKEFFEDVHSEEGPNNEGNKEQLSGEKRKIGEDGGEDEDEDEDEIQITGERKGTTTEEQAGDKKGHYTCYVCNALVPKVEYSKRQRRKKTKRRMKCKRCMGEAVGKNVSEEPLSAAEIYRMNKDRFIGC